MNRLLSSILRLSCPLVGLVGSVAGSVCAEDVGKRWGTEEREREYYPIVNIPLPKDTVIEAGAIAVLPDGRVAVGPRPGDISFPHGAHALKLRASFHLFAAGLRRDWGGGGGGGWVGVATNGRACM